MFRRHAASWAWWEISGLIIHYRLTLLWRNSHQTSSPPFKIFWCLYCDSLLSVLSRRSGHYAVVFVKFAVRLAAVSIFNQLLLLLSAWVCVCVHVASQKTRQMKSLSHPRTEWGCCVAAKDSGRCLCVCCESALLCMCVRNKQTAAVIERLPSLMYCVFLAADALLAFSSRQWIYFCRSGRFSHAENFQQLLKVYHLQWKHLPRCFPSFTQEEKRLNSFGQTRFWALPTAARSCLSDCFTPRTSVGKFPQFRIQQNQQLSTRTLKVSVRLCQQGRSSGSLNTERFILWGARTSEQSLTSLHPEVLVKRNYSRDQRPHRDHTGRDIHLRITATDSFSNVWVKLLGKKSKSKIICISKVLGSLKAKNSTFPPINSIFEESKKSHKSEEREVVLLQQLPEDQHQKQHFNLERSSEERIPPPGPNSPLSIKLIRHQTQHFNLINPDLYLNLQQ